MIEYIDTHCHVHASDYTLSPVDVLARAKAAGVTKLICVGTDVQTSIEATTYAEQNTGVWASIGLHPHDAKLGRPAFDDLALLTTKSKLVAVGECGLDYFYNHSDKSDQFVALRFQIELALEHNLPMIFHVRDAFDDFWPIFDSYNGIRGVVHSFTATRKELDDILTRGLYVGLNGIMTFTKNQDQLDAARAVPLKRLLLETDAPFLTPVPLRGKVNEPKNVIITAEFLADLRGEDVSTLASATTQNASHLFGI